MFFFDTPELTLNQAGVVVRARRVAGRGGDTVVKLRPVVPDELPDDLRQSGSVGVEVDAMPGGFVCSASMKGKATNDAVREAVAGERPLRKLFSKEQRAFFAANAPDGVDLDDLTVLGPTFVLKETIRPAGFDGRQAGRGDVAHPRRVAGLRALDEVPALARRSRLRWRRARSSKVSVSSSHRIRRRRPRPRSTSSPAS